MLISPCPFICVVGEVAILAFPHITQKVLVTDMPLFFVARRKSFNFERGVMKARKPYKAVHQVNHQ